MLSGFHPPIDSTWSGYHSALPVNLRREGIGRIFPPARMPVNQERSQDGQDNLQEDIHNKREERISRRPFLSILARLRQDLVDEVADVVNECVHEAGENC